VDPKKLAQLEARARFFKAIAHPTRLFIVEELNRSERCVCELTAMVGADISTVSKHLSVLKNTGVVRDEKRGAKVFYSLVCSCVLEFLPCIDAVLQQAALERMELLR